LLLREPGEKGFWREREGKESAGRILSKAQGRKKHDPKSVKERPPPAEELAVRKGGGLGLTKQKGGKRKTQGRKRGANAEKSFLSPKSPRLRGEKKVKKRGSSIFQGGDFIDNQRENEVACT